MPIPYPSSPTVGQTFTYGGITYTWNGVAWTYTQTNTPAVVGSVAVTAPITNTGTPTAPVIGINQSALSITRSQVSDFSGGSVAQATVAGTASYADTAGTSVNISGTIAQSQVTNLVTDLAGKANLVGGNTFTGAQIVTVSGTASIPLVVRGTAGQSANLLQIETAISTAIRVNSVGNTTFVGNITSQNNATFTPNSTATIPLAIQGLSGQSAYLTEWRNSAGGTVIGIDSSGVLQAFNGIRSNSLTNTTTFNNARIQTGNTGTIIDTGIFNNPALRVQNTNSTATANLTEWLSSAGGTVAYIAPTGFLNINNASLRVNTAGATYGARIQTSTDGTAVIGIVVRGVASQSANLQEWQNSAGGTIALVNSSGDFVTPNGAMFIGSGYLDAKLSINTQLASQKGIVVRAATSQTADLQQWQNSSGGTVAYMQAAGNLKANNIATFNSQLQMAQNAGGGLQIWARATAAYANPGANFAATYFRDGTLAGTLRFVSITGASGVEETLIDNISSGTAVASARFTGAGGVNTAGSVISSAGLSLSGTTAPILLNGSAGTSGQVLTSGGAGTTPTWTTVGGGGGSFTGGTLTSDLVLAAGSTAVEPLTFQANTSTPTTTAGALDYDGDKFNAVTSGTATGRLMIPAVAWAFSNASATSATSTTSQSIFQAGARTLTLEANKTYYFKLLLNYSYAFSAGAPFNIQLVPTFSNTQQEIFYTVATIAGTSAYSNRYTVATASQISPSFSSGSGSGHVVRIEGFFRTNATTGGTIEFKYQLNTSGSSATMTSGCYQQIIKLGSASNLFGTTGIVSGAWA